jgi:8-oxo-dGTP diphosphatase
MTVVAVAASLVRAPDGRVLLAERTPRQLSAGFWEAPGGRVDPGETPRQAAVRELEEEVGIQAIDPRPWLTYDHAFPTRRIRLSWFLVDRWTGTPRGIEGQRIAWAHPADPPVSPILASNHRALASLALPPIYLHLPAGDGGPEACLAQLRLALAGGARLVRLGGGGLDQGVMFARRAADLARAHGARVMIEGSALEARRAGVTGVHSSAADLASIAIRPPTPAWAATCEDADDLERATTLGADFVVLASPPVPDWDHVRRITSRARLPVYLAADRAEPVIEAARRAGAVGIAAGGFGVARDRAAASRRGAAFGDAAHAR